VGRILHYIQTRFVPREQPTRPRHVDVALQSPAAEAQNAGITRLAREGDLLDLRARGVADVVDCVTGVEENAVDENVVASMAIRGRRCAR